MKADVNRSLQGGDGAGGALETDYYSQLEGLIFWFWIALPARPKDGGVELIILYINQVDILKDILLLQSLFLENSGTLTAPYPRPTRALICPTSFSHRAKVPAEIYTIASDWAGHLPTVYGKLFLDSPIHFHNSARRPGDANLAIILSFSCQKELSSASYQSREGFLHNVFPTSPFPWTWAVWDGHDLLPDFSTSTF